MLPRKHHQTENFQEMLNDETGRQRLPQPSHPSTLQMSLDYISPPTKNPRCSPSRHPQFLHTRNSDAQTQLNSIGRFWVKISQYIQEAYMTLTGSSAMFSDFLASSLAWEGASHRKECLKAPWLEG